jgi:Trk K+ transport system NAD-binding subunit
MKSRIVIAGLGETGFDLARKLAHNWRVVGIDTDRGAIERVGEDLDAEHDVSLHVGDATSALVLKHAELGGVHAVVTCTGSDEINAEVCRVARDSFQVENLFALMYSVAWEDHYRNEGIELVSQDRACSAILESRVERGQKVATGVGLGDGEIVEVVVLPNSSVVGRSLAQLRPRRWLVGAIYRDGALIVPHGDTVIAAGDRVLLVGDPAVLPSIASLIRSGESEFPLHYGTHVVGLCGPEIERVVDEAAYLIEATRADRFEVLACEAEASSLTSLEARCHAAKLPYRITAATSGTLPALADAAAERDVGVLIVPPEPLGLLSRIGLRRSPMAEVIDRITSPVLMSRETYPYRRVMLVLAELPLPTMAGQAAIDLVRIVGGDLILGVVHQPDLVAGTELREEVEERRLEIENLAGMYHVDITVHEFEGNPIVEIEQASREYDLLVLPFKRRRKAFLTRPDVPLNLLHRAHCSVLAMPY